MRQKVDTDQGLLILEYDGALVDAVGKALGNLKDQRFKVLKNAVNATAKEAQAQLVAKAQETYTAKKGPLKRAAAIKPKATDSKPEATITVKGKRWNCENLRPPPPKAGPGRKSSQAAPSRPSSRKRAAGRKPFLLPLRAATPPSYRGRTAKHTAGTAQSDGQNTAPILI